MSDQTQIDEMLLKAVEYLSKLGRNLNARSTNIKENRLQKDKIKNFHALKRLSGKILKVCELSKKSIENVEECINEVLNICSENSNFNIRDNFKIIKYKSSQLKIPSEISYSHYQSCKVRAKNWPLSMLEEYPVYCKCKELKRRMKVKRLAQSCSISYKNKLAFNKECSPIELLSDDDSVQPDQIKHHSNSDANKTAEDVYEEEGEKLSSKSMKSNSTEGEVDKNLVENKDRPAPAGGFKIRCVDITKLLDVDKKIPINSDQSANKKQKTQNSKTKSQHKIIHMKKLVENFKSKSFTININKLGRMNHSFLKKHHLSKITQYDGGIITQFPVKQTMKQAKMQLLHDSDSEHVKTPKKQLLNDSSDSEIEKQKKKSPVNKEKRKKHMASMQARRRLLSSTSSSDEELKDALNTIRDEIEDSIEADKRKEIGKKTEKDNVEDEKEVKDKSNCSQNETSKVSKNSDNPKNNISNPKKRLLESSSSSGENFAEKELEKLKRRKKNLIESSSNEENRITKETAEKCESKGDEDLNVGKKSSVERDSEGLDTNREHESITDKRDNNSENSEKNVENAASVKSLQKNGLKLNENPDEADEIKSDIEKTNDFKPKECNKNDNQEEQKIRKSKSSCNEADQSLDGNDPDSSDNNENKHDIKQTNSAVNIGDREKIKIENQKSDSEIKSIESKNTTGNAENPDSDNLETVKEPTASGVQDDTELPLVSNEKGENETQIQEKENCDDTVTGTNPDTKTNSSGNDENVKEISQNGDDKVSESGSSSKSKNKKCDVNKKSKRDSLDSGSAVTTRSAKKKSELLDDKVLLDSADSSDSEVDTEEALPDIPVVIGVHDLGKLAKDDLLNDSDNSLESSSSSEDEKSQESSTKISNKAKEHLLTSSDSENTKTTSSAKKKRANSDSDFESNESDSSGTNKRKQRNKRKLSTSSGSSDASRSAVRGPTKKKKTVKNIDSSNESGSDKEEDGKKSGRKNIRRVMGKDQLEKATKKAVRKEEERVARILEKNELYKSKVFDEEGDCRDRVVDEVVLDYDPETKEPLISVDQGIVKKLKPHQANGIKFMWDACFESVKQITKSKGSGCILAHCMGLGKTLQVVALIHTLMLHSKLTSVKRVLVVCPLSTVLNWVNEIQMWTEMAEEDANFDVFELSKYKLNTDRATILRNWHRRGGICVLGYDMFRNLSAQDSKKFRKKNMLANFQQSLVDPGPELVICDEGHLLKNEKTSVSQAMNRIRTRRRIVLTGTPLQNNLKEYFCMVDFVKPNLLGNYNEYLNRFVNPITNGQYVNSTEHDIRLMKRRSHVLHKMLEGSVQRRDYSVLAPFLPPKHEYVVFITLTDLQIKLYQFYLENISKRSVNGSGYLFPDFQALQRIWTHPLCLQMHSERNELANLKKLERGEEDSEGSLADFIDDDESTAEETGSSSESDFSSNDEENLAKQKSKKKEKKVNGINRRPKTRATAELEVEEQVEENNAPKEWWSEMVNEDDFDDIRHSHKLLLLFDVLKHCQEIKDKVLVFSQSIYSLDLIEHFLAKIDEATLAGTSDPKLGGHTGSWEKGVDYFRLDGSTSCENRSRWCKKFNREADVRGRLFLVSTRAGGLGINLFAANRVIIFDVSWNPSHDVQSIFRVYRFGQKKHCHIYRFLAMGTMEEKIYERQVTKQAISKRVIDEQQIDRHYAANDLQELYKFTPKPEEPRALPNVPKDRLFADMLKENELLIYKYHEHDSLLENKEEETLTEEERRAAWEDFENEKNRPPPPPVQPFTGLLGPQAGAMRMYNPQTPLMATLFNMFPTLTPLQINSMLPMIRSDPKFKHLFEGLGNPNMVPGNQFAPVNIQGPRWPNQYPGPRGIPISGSAPGRYVPRQLTAAEVAARRLQMMMKQQENYRRLKEFQNRSKPIETGVVVDIGDSDCSFNKATALV